MQARGSEKVSTGGVTETGRVQKPFASFPSSATPRRAPVGAPLSGEPSETRCWLPAGPAPCHSASVVAKRRDGDPFANASIVDVFQESKSSTPVF